MKNSLVLLFIFLVISSCYQSENGTSEINEIAGNDEIAEFLNSFQGRGALSDQSSPTPPSEAVKNFTIPEDLKIELVLSEPDVLQPLELTFDHRGRLWVVQYTQYPYPKGLKVTGIDNHLRAKFDRVPDPPPVGVPGADKISFFEDTDGDGKFDQSTDAIVGLNIATGVEFGRNRIWVLNPPYLLAYPDLQGDGLPDDDPEVHLTGFGIEDTHAVANSLRWGPDGWLYGATGSTVTSNISSQITKNVQFDGQGIWRYHPSSKVFELFAEGGGNTFHIEIDSKGRIYSGDNGAETRGQYYKQGAYYIKNWGKHGALTNPYAFGYLKNMALEGDALRFTHAWIKYEGDGLPSNYHEKLIAINPLLNYLQLSNIIPNGSTFRNQDLYRVLETEDHWFRPVDIKVGPDGAVYLADWYDSRLSHVDPNDTWHRGSGRIYRISGNQQTTSLAFDLSDYTDKQLIELLDHPNKWYRNQALRLIGDRADPSNVDELIQTMANSQGQLALEALWAINLITELKQEVITLGLSHQDPYVRLWMVRLIGDKMECSEETARQLEKLSNQEKHPEVQSQLASSAKRLPSRVSLPMLKNLMKQPALETDPDNPMLVWWALESKIANNAEAVIDLFTEAQIWKYPVVVSTILERLSQRLVMAGGSINMEQCARLLTLAPNGELATPVLQGIQEGLRGSDISQLPSSLIAAINARADAFGSTPLLIPIRQGQEKAIDQAINIVQSTEADLNEKLVYIGLFGELGVNKAVPVLLQIMEDGNSRISLRISALNALSNYELSEIGKRAAAAYPSNLRADPKLRLTALNLLASRSNWALELIALIEDHKQVRSDDLPPQIVQKLLLLNDKQVNDAVSRIWPETLEASNKEKRELMEKIKRVINSNNTAVDYNNGESLYQQLCGSCHQLFDSGGNIGPDLTGYDRRNLNYLILNIVDPNMEIREGYVNYKLVTADGRTVLGIITDRTSEMVSLRSFNGDEFTVSSNKIVELEAQPSSIMPERLIDHLSDQQLRDLFAYIMEEKPKIDN